MSTKPDPVSEVMALAETYAQALVDDFRNAEGYDVGKDTDQCDNCIRVERAALESKVRELEKEAARYRHLQSVPGVEAQMYFWNYTSRKTRNAAIDAAIDSARSQNPQNPSDDPTERHG